jgi:hypothetical protein
MEKPKEVLSIPSHTDEELDSITYDDIIAEASRVADDRHCCRESCTSRIPFATQWIATTTVD